MIEFQILLGEVKTYPVVQGWENLTDEQREMVNDQCWREEDFDDRMGSAKQELFWQIGDTMYSQEMDLMQLGIFAFNGWQWQYYAYGKDYLAAFSLCRKFIEVVEVLDITQELVPF